MPFDLDEILTQLNKIETSETIISNSLSSIKTGLLAIKQINDLNQSNKQRFEIVKNCKNAYKDLSKLFSYCYDNPKKVPEELEKFCLNALEMLNSISSQCLQYIGAQIQSFNPSPADTKAQNSSFTLPSRTQDSLRLMGEKRELEYRMRELEKLQINVAIGNSHSWRQFEQELKENSRLGEKLYQQFTTVEPNTEENDLYHSDDDNNSVSEQPINNKKTNVINQERVIIPYQSPNQFFQQFQPESSQARNSPTPQQESSHNEEKQEEYIYR